MTARQVGASSSRFHDWYGGVFSTIEVYRDDFHAVPPRRLIPQDVREILPVLHRVDVQLEYLVDRVVEDIVEAHIDVVADDLLPVY